MLNLLMILYAGIIPVVPLIGFEIFKKKKEHGKQLVCLLLFAIQLCISAYAIYWKFFR